MASTLVQLSQLPILACNTPHPVSFLELLSWLLGHSFSRLLPISCVAAGSLLLPRNGSTQGEHSRGALQGSTPGLNPCSAAWPGLYIDFTYCCSFECLPPVPCWLHIHLCVHAPSLTSPVSFRGLLYTSAFMPTGCLYLSSSNMRLPSSSQACPTHPSPPSFWMLRVLTPLRFSC